MEQLLEATQSVFPTALYRPIKEPKQDITPTHTLGSPSLLNVTITSSFWLPRLKTNQEITIPAIYQMLEETGRLDMILPHWTPPEGVQPHFYWDSDVAKWIEAASYSLTYSRNPALEEKIDDVIDRWAKIQLAEGYLNSYFINVDPKNRWKNFGFFHELYCAGHIIEAGVAHFHVTGKQTFLKIVCRLADYLDHKFRSETHPGFPGHQGIELALIRLYRVTGEQRYLALSQLFLDRRGNSAFLKEEVETLPPHLSEDNRRFFGEGEQFCTEYCQDHLPIREQSDGEGHSVRAMYMYCAMTDIVYETGDQALWNTLEKLWESVCQRRMYLTGGIGSSRENEGFTRDYDLPNESAYAETCAAIGLFFWNHRMLHVDSDGKYADIMERVLFNGILSSVSLDGKQFFYENPLQSDGNHHRKSWFDVSCCPPNVSRLFASLGKYIYSEGPHSLFVNLYLQSQIKTQIGEQTVTIEQMTNYPWNSVVSFSLKMDHPTLFSLHLRIPQWCHTPSLSINNQFFDLWTSYKKGYVQINRTWESGDEIILNLPMRIEHVRSHPEVKQNVGCVAIQRGPLVYCLEQVDQSVPLHKIIIPKQTEWYTTFDKNLLGGLVVLQGMAMTPEPQRELYSQSPIQYQPYPVRAIPYFAWDNRDPGPMKVWLHSEI